MRNFGVLIVVFCALFFETIAMEKCPFSDHYTQCARSDTCKELLNSNIVYSLEECGHSEANACKDFFQRTNGGFYALSANKLKTALFDHQSYAGPALESPNVTNVENLKNILKSYHSSCYHAHYQIKFPMPIFLNGLENIETLHWPNWSLAVQQEQWQQNDFDWLNALGELRRLGLNNVFFKEHVTLAYNDADKLILELDMPMEKTKRLIEYKSLLQTKRDHYDGEAVYENIELMQQINELDERIRNLRLRHLNIGVRTLAEKEILTLKQLKIKIPHIDWEKYFSALLKRPIDASTFVIQLKNPSYFQEVSAILKQTNSKVINFYIFLRFKDFYSDIAPITPYTECAKSVADHFAFGANYIYYRWQRVEHEMAERSVKDIFEALRTQLAKKLTANKNKLSESTLESLNEKLNKIELRFGTTPLNFSNDFYNDFYAGLNISTEWRKIVDNLREILRFRVKKQHDSLFQAPTKVELDYYFAFQDSFEQPIEPFYVAQRNFIVVPQAFLHPPFVMHRAHPIFQYATSGFGIARALMAAFMPDAIVYDAAGRECDMGLEILQNEDYITDFTCIRGASKNFQQRFPDIPALQLLIDTFISKFGDIQEDVLNLRREEVMHKNYNLEDLFFRFLGHYFRGSRSKDLFGFSADERLNDIVEHIPEFKKLYNCANNTRICALW